MINTENNLPGSAGFSQIKRFIATGLAILAAILIVRELIDITHDVRKVIEANSGAFGTSDVIHPVAISRDQHVFRFVAFGDSGTGSRNQHAVASTMERRCARIGGYDGLLVLGDVIYPSGVATGDDSKWTQFFDDVYRKSSCLRDVVAYPVLGNHDYHGSVRAWFERSLNSTLWRFPSRSWAVSFSDVLTVVGVDSSQPWFGGVDSIDAKGVSTAWRVALGHHPLESASDSGGRHRGGGIGGFALERALCGEVDAYFSGHAHHLEHRYIERCALEHFVSGAAGAGISGVRTEDDAAAFAISRHGFMEIVVTRNRLVVHAFDVAGRLLYTTKMSRSDVVSKSNDVSAEEMI